MAQFQVEIVLDGKLNNPIMNKCCKCDNESTIIQILKMLKEFIIENTRMIQFI